MRKLVLSFCVAALVLVVCGKPVVHTKPGEVYKRVARPEIWQILPRTQAESVGLQSGDLVLSYNQEPVRTNDEIRRAQARALGSKGRIPVVVLRGDKELEFSVEPGPLGGMPVAAKYPSSLALALEDIMRHFGLFADYDWLAALSGESFTFTARADECRAWWPGGKSGEYLAQLADMTGLSIERLGARGQGLGVDAIKQELLRGRTVLVHGGWPDHRYGFWGIATRYDMKDSLVYGYSLDSAEELGLTGLVDEAYVVAPADDYKQPDELLARVLTQALELTQAYSDTGWKSGIQAYDLLLTSLDTVPFCPVCGTEESQACFDRLVWATIAHKQSANRFLQSMKLASPEQAGLLDETIADNQAIIGKLEGIARSSVRLGRLEDQRKLALILSKVQLIENDLIGLYEALLVEF